MKLFNSLVSFAVIVATQAFEATSKHTFDFKQYAEEVAAAKADKQSQRKLHQHIVQGRKHAAARSDEMEEILFSPQCQTFVLRMIDAYPELYYEDFLDIGLFACNPMSYDLMLHHYTAGVNQTALAGEPDICVETFSYVLLETIDMLEELHSDQQFCDYEAYIGSDACASMNMTEVEQALLDPWTPAEVTEVCTSGEAIDVVVAFFEAILGPHEEDPCRHAMKQIIVDNIVDFDILAANDQVCLALMASMESGRSARMGDDPQLGCLPGGVCLPGH